jgi:hypothetical protein
MLNIDDYDPKSVDTTSGAIIPFSMDISGLVGGETFRWFILETGEVLATTQNANIEMLLEYDGRNIVGDVALGSISYNFNPDTSKPYTNTQPDDITISNATTTSITYSNLSAFANIIGTARKWKESTFSISFRIQTAGDKGYFTVAGYDAGLGFVSRLMAVYPLLDEGRWQILAFNQSVYYNTSITSANVTAVYNGTTVVIELRNDTGGLLFSQSFGGDDFSDVVFLRYSFSVNSATVDVTNYSSDITVNDNDYERTGNIGLSIEPVDKFVSKIIQGENTGSICVEAGYKVTIEMALKKSVDSRGYVRWRDDGSASDKYRSSLPHEGVTPQTLELLMADDSEDDYVITTPVANGFYPLGMYFATGQNYTVTFLNKYRGEDLDIFGKIRMYDIEFAPKDPDVYNTYTPSGTINDCGRHLKDCMET